MSNTIERGQEMLCFKAMMAAFARAEKMDTEETMVTLAGAPNVVCPLGSAELKALSEWAGMLPPLMLDRILVLCKDTIADFFIEVNK